MMGVCGEGACRGWRRNPPVSAPAGTNRGATLWGVQRVYGLMIVDEVDVEVAEGSAAGVEDLCRAEYPALVRLAFLLTGSTAIGEDLVQEAFVSLLRRWETVNNPRAYVRACVVNGAKGHLRRRAVERRHLLDPPRPVASPEIDEMWDLLAGLSPRRRAALVLRFYEDLPIAEIAKVMGVRPGTVKSLIHRGLESLREMLA